MLQNTFNKVLGKPLKNKEASAICLSCDCEKKDCNCE